MVLSGSLASRMHHEASVSCKALPDPSVEAAEKLRNNDGQDPHTHFDKTSRIAAVAVGCNHPGTGMVE